ncbi:hypothetical protein [Dongia sedimenti]|uniref:Secreted protein n=1 Tax=Dongia sedimenti TaxID=3064282 RepID=A0ABU0YKD2_9PROT|nr:hypothetical protein [Rhodospirillaceae bacterium R-7]
MKITLIALGAGTGCLLLAGSAMAGPCSAQIDALTKQMAATDAGMGPTGGAGASTLQQSGANPVSPSGTPQTPTTPATGTMNEASQNKATSPQDVQNQNTGQGTMADQAAGDTAGGSTAAAAALARAQALDAAGDASCFGEVNKAQHALTP